MSDDVVVALIVLIALWWLAKRGGLATILPATTGNASSASGQVPNYSASSNTGITTTGSGVSGNPTEGKASSLTSIADQTSVIPATNSGTATSGTTTASNGTASAASSSLNQPAQIASSSGGVTVYTASNGQHVTVNEAKSGYVHPPQWQVNQLAAIQSEPTQTLAQIQAENRAARAQIQSANEAAIAQAHAANLSSNYTGYFHVNLPNGNFYDAYFQNGTLDGMHL